MKDRIDEYLTAKEYIKERPVTDSPNTPPPTRYKVINRNIKSIFWRGEAEYNFGGYNTSKQ